MIKVIRVRKVHSKLSALYLHLKGVRMALNYVVDMWFNTCSGELYVYYSGNWLGISDATGPQGPQGEQGPQGPGGLQGEQGTG